MSAFVFRTDFRSAAFFGLMNALYIALTAVNYFKDRAKWTKVEKQLDDVKDHLIDYRTALYEVSN